MCGELIQYSVHLQKYVVVIVKLRIEPTAGVSRENRTPTARVAPGVNKHFCVCVCVVGGERERVESFT